jgi:hypothetical protein
VSIRITVIGGGSSSMFVLRLRQDDLEVLVRRKL